MEVTNRSRIHIRFASGVFWFNCLAVVSLICMCLWVTIAGYTKIHSGAVPFATGVFGLTISVPVLLLLLMKLRPIVLTKSQVQIPKFIGHESIAVSDVAGVGLLYRWVPMSRVPPGWVLNIWDKNGKRYPVDKIIVTTWKNPLPKDQRPQRRIRIGGGSESAPFPFEEDPSGLSSTHPARVACQIYDWVLQVQGPTGSLANQELQKKVKRDPWSSVKTVGWWSPDIMMGRIT